MRFIISGRNMTVSDKLKDAVYEKLGKLDKYFNVDTDCYVRFSYEKQRQKIEVTIPVKGHTFRAEQTSEDMFVSLDMAQEIIIRQLRKYKTKLTKQHRQNYQPAFVEMDTGDEEDVHIVRSKKFAIKPMDPEDACVEMELLNHSFYVFRNATTDQVNVVYKRSGNTYGLIEPEE